MPCCPPPDVLHPDWSRCIVRTNFVQGCRWLTVINSLICSTSSQSAGNQFKGPSASLATRGVVSRAPAHTGAAGVHVQVCVVLYPCLFLDSAGEVPLSLTPGIYLQFGASTCNRTLTQFDRWKLSLALKRKSILNIFPPRWSDHAKKATLMSRLTWKRMETFENRRSQSVQILKPHSRLYFSGLTALRPPQLLSCLSLMRVKSKALVGFRALQTLRFSLPPCSLIL